MPLRLRFVNRRFLYRLTAVLLLLAGTETGAFFYQRHRANGAVQSFPFPIVSPLSGGASVLVVAPHCDDETLGVGGLIHQATRAGARVRIVFLTNGDGFPLAVSRQYFKLRPTPNSYIRFAYHRQAEAVAALRELGVPREQVTFLGYPDGGLASLWSRSWRPDQLYRSRYTGRTHSPYTNSFRKNAPYSGSDLLTDLRTILRQEAPTHIYAPHPGDDHPDHWAGYCFLIAALRENRLADEATFGRQMGGREEPRVYTYLVHRGDWPVPQGLRPEARLVPPMALLGLDTRWATVPLDPAAREAKARALARYQSQMAVMRRFLQSFLRADELLGAVPMGAVPLMPIGPSSMAAESGLLLPVIADCAEDTLLRDLNGSADLVSLAAATDGRVLRLRLEARLPLSRRVRYRLRLHPLGCRDPDRGGEPLTLTFRAGKCDRPEASCLRRGRFLDAEVPLVALGRPRELLLGADTELARVAVDRICWRAVRLPELSPPMSVRR